MSHILTRNFAAQSPFAMKKLPFLSRLYRRIFNHQPATRRIERLLNAILRQLFRPYYSLCRSPKLGWFDYKRAGQISSIQFDARNLQFQALYNECFKHGYELEVCGLLDALLPEGGIFFDVGSNWGFFSLYTASLRKQLTIHAFEPFPKSYQDLVRCVEQAGLSGMVSSHNVALSAADGEAFIQMPDGIHSGKAEITTSATLGARITTRRLDSLDLPPPDFIKMDVEGHEIDVLEGAKKILETTRPFIVFENKPNYVSPLKTLAPLFFLQKFGYQFFIPAIQRRHNGCAYLMQAGWHAVNDGDQLALVAFTPETRFLYQTDVNVFACPQVRRQQLLTAFNIMEAMDSGF